jgi:hypothetical protein
VLRKCAAALAGRYEIRTDVTESGQAVAVANGGESSESATRDVLEQHPLDGILGAEREDLVHVWNGRHGIRIGGSTGASAAPLAAAKERAAASSVVPVAAAIGTTCVLASRAFRAREAQQTHRPNH